eukprot:15536420-Heterocapsa_arctica.AAC.1
MLCFCWELWGSSAVQSAAPELRPCERTVLGIVVVVIVSSSSSSNHVIRWAQAKAERMVTSLKV